MGAFGCGGDQLRLHAEPGLFGCACEARALSACMHVCVCVGVYVCVCGVGVVFKGPLRIRSQ